MADDRRALIVATSEYEDEGLAQLRSPSTDAEALARVLADPALGGFEVDTVLNETSTTIRTRVEALFRSGRRDDLLLLHFSCHGLKDSYGELHLAARDTRPDLLEATAIHASFVNRLMHRSRADRVVVLLDCCYGGAFERGETARAGSLVNMADQFSIGSPEPGQGRGRVVIAASSATEFSFEGADLADGARVQPSYFTSALVEGLSSGRADRDQDGQVSLGELYDFVFERVRERSPKQTPQKSEYGVQGQIHIARNPNRIIVPGTLPAELTEGLEHPKVQFKLASVAWLEELANGQALDQAAAALAELHALTGGDSKKVSEEASAVLERTNVSVNPGWLDLGTVVVGASAEAQATFGGPPIGAASTVSMDGPGFTVRRTADGFRVSIEAREPGRIIGNVIVSGPAGTATVPVEANVVVASWRVGVESAPVTTEPTGETTIHPSPAIPAPPDPPPALVPEPPGLRAALVDTGPTVATALPGTWMIDRAGLFTAGGFLVFVAAGVRWLPPELGAINLVLATLGAAGLAATIFTFRTSSPFGAGLVAALGVVMVALAYGAYGYVRDGLATALVGGMASLSLFVGGAVMIGGIRIARRRRGTRTRLPPTIAAIGIAAVALAILFGSPAQDKDGEAFAFNGFEYLFAMVLTVALGLSYLQKISVPMLLGAALGAALGALVPLLAFIFTWPDPAAWPHILGGWAIYFAAPGLALGAVAVGFARREPTVAAAPA